MSDEPAHPRYLNEPFIQEQLLLERVQELLRPLCLDASSPLPRRMRIALANFVRRLTVFRRELKHQSEQIRRERQREFPGLLRPEPDERA